MDCMGKLVPVDTVVQLYPKTQLRDAQYNEDDLCCQFIMPVYQSRTGQHQQMLMINCA